MIGSLGWGACVTHAPQRRFRPGHARRDRSGLLGRTGAGQRARRPRGSRGAITAEAAIVIPVLAAVALGCVWLLSVAVAQVRVTDAAREVARVVARGDEESSAITLGRRIAPDKAAVRIGREEGQIRVEVKAPAASPIGFLRFIPTPTVKASAVAVKEVE